jgi:SAM-dependent methyltransferase
MSRPPTSHERQAGASWDASYADGPAPWDIGAPQPAVVRLAGDGAFTGAVLDAGCGTGDNALPIASLGLHVLGFDVAATAVSIARARAADRGADAEFLVADALRLHGLGRQFDTVLDCALLHTFDHEERRRYLASLASAVRPGGRLHVLCFSDVGPGPHGPIRSVRTSCGRRSAPTAVGASAPSRRTASPRGSPWRACRPGWRASTASRSRTPFMMRA